MVYAARITEEGSKALTQVDQIRDRLRDQLRGKEELIDFAMACLLARGHLLLEGPPGTGKTSLAKAMAHSFGGSFRRIQLTSDMLPSDVVGILRLRPGTTEFEFRKGPIFTHFLLADELNRTSPKTQSALLEAMAEGTVTVDGTTHPLPDPFFVVATQNPLEFQGVYPLAESQLDRFMLQLLISCPDREDELKIYQRSLGADRLGAPRKQESARPESIITIDQARRIFEEVEKVHVESSVLEYATALVRATRSRTDVSYGVSVRGGLQFVAASKALAFVRGRTYVLPKDVSDLAVPALAHRLCFVNGDPDTNQRCEVIRQILEKVRPPK